MQTGCSLQAKNMKYFLFSTGELSHCFRLCWWGFGLSKGLHPAAGSSWGGRAEEKQLQAKGRRRRESWLPAQHPISGAGTRVSWPPSQTQSPGLASRCQRIGPGNYPLAAPRRVNPHRYPGRTLRRGRIRPFTACVSQMIFLPFSPRDPVEAIPQGPVLGEAGPGSGARAGLRVPPHLLGFAGGWLEPSAAREAGGEAGTHCPPAPIPMPTRGYGEDTCAAQFPSLGIVSLCPSPGTAQLGAQSDAVLPALKRSCRVRGMLGALLGALIFLYATGNSQHSSELLSSLFLLIKKKREEKKKSPEASPSCLFLKPSPTSNMLSNCFPPALSLRPLSPL